MAAIKVAKRFDLGADDVLLTVATDGAELYRSEHQRILQRDYPDGFEKPEAEREFGRHLEGLTTDHLLDATQIDRERIFNLGYFTWVEQQGVTIDDFTARKHQAFWRGLYGRLVAGDERIEEFNARTGLTAG